MSSSLLLEKIARFGPLNQRRDALGVLQGVLKTLGDPAARLPPVFHVTGTNGKGSVTAFLSHCLQAQGYEVHRFLSPHIHSYRERIELNGLAIGEELFGHYLDMCWEAGAGRLTLFEALTVCAFLAFSQHPAHAVIMEVGIGGLLDPTNQVTTTCVSLITAISPDHLDILGPTLAHVARQKSGIMRRGVPCVVAPQVPEVMDVLMAQAQQLETPLLSCGDAWDYVLQDQGFIFQNKRPPFSCYPYPEVALEGAHQRENAAVAVAALYAQEKLAMSHKAIAQGLSRVSWPGRLQRLRGGAQSLFPDTWELWVDGAHNEGGARVLVQHLKTCWQDKPLVLVLAVLQKKDGQALWRLLTPWAQDIGIIQSLGCPEDGSPWVLTGPEVFLACGTPPGHAMAEVHSYATFGDFFATYSCRGVHKFPQGARVLFCGSLYGASSVLAWHHSLAQNTLPSGPPHA